MQLTFAGKITNFNYTESKKIFFYCLPGGVNNEDLIRVLVKFGKEYPELLYLRSDIFVIKAFEKYYPCNKH